jgi:hypothetical protein
MPLDLQKTKKRTCRRAAKTAPCPLAVVAAVLLCRAHANPLCWKRFVVIPVLKAVLASRGAMREGREVRVDEEEEERAARSGRQGVGGAISGRG